MLSTSSSPPSTEFVSLLTEHQADLWAFIISQLPGNPEVGDILQKTNLTLWTKREQFAPGSNFRAWAFSVARFEVLAHLKKHKRGNWLIFNDELLETISMEAPAAIPESSLRLKLLESCTAKLQPQHRDLLNHRYQSKDGLASYAKQCGRSVSSLSVTLHRVRATLRKCIETGLAKHLEKGDVV
ncbi:sigma-70 family RNA polymerase sigma factor [Verrucomicrobiaceae bacterium N1E253]|uniref:Sigma-70 family RNA polymerase sigma factor n=1 Tax=Oceaniferula marina TaxID=2748318 RepID=A0A851GEX5_9BACT|nr:sigma-70 family RNA polymerase sigma factor [Oceaniferula marina]NWK55739.1 sigma-70 family RNA polymerase sigma factor [Oceaniferula marina]